MHAAMQLLAWRGVKRHPKKQTLAGPPLSVRRAPPPSCLSLCRCGCFGMENLQLLLHTRCLSLSVSFVLWSRTPKSSLAKTGRRETASPLLFRVVSCCFVVLDSLLLLFVLLPLLPKNKRSLVVGVDPRATIMMTRR